MNNYWHTYSSDLVWEMRLPWQPGDPAYRRWERTVLDSGEAHTVYLVAETRWTDPLDYKRDRDGYLGDVLDARPEFLWAVAGWGCAAPAYGTAPPASRVAPTTYGVYAISGTNGYPDSKPNSRTNDQAKPNAIGRVWRPAKARAFLPSSYGSHQGVLVCHTGWAGRVTMRTTPWSSKANHCPCIYAGRRRDSPVSTWAVPRAIRGRDLPASAAGAAPP